jgi:hypothetical protein
MLWQATATIPISIGARVSAARADAIGAALLRRAVPLSRVEAGRLQPLATAALLADGEHVGLLTAAHIFECTQAGDIAIPLPRDRRLAQLRFVRVSVITHPLNDLAIVWIENRSLAQRLCFNWEAGPAHEWDAAGAVPASYVLAGYPACNARRIDGCVYAKPLILFTDAVDAQRYAYARTAERLDGQTIWTPELDGVSGATLWSIHEEADDGIACVLQPAAIQVAFMHGTHLRAESIDSIREFLSTSARSNRRRHELPTPAAALTTAASTPS